ncbi:MAG TPA: Gfo/Idh/MocA family oxidoreductase [Mycobacteriales bacterium]|jgi:predicted dehydrogenase|nr:Gfo/Idh/MocA family oxidoreductase [Mycobacteriales bacterium]
MPPTRIAVVGAGYIAGRHVESLTTLPDVQVAAVCDPQADRAAALAARCGAAVHADPEAMLAAVPVDAVYVCVPPGAHGDPERTVLRRGLGLFVEKPLAADLETAEALAAEVAAAGVPTATGYHWRYLDTVEQAVELLADRPPRLLVGSWLDRTPGTPWWPVRAASGGQLVEQATHLVDLARLLAGEVDGVSAVAARSPAGAGDIDHVAAATLRFRSGAIGSLTASCLLRRGWRMGLEVVADGLALALTERELTVDDGDGPRTVPAGVDPMLRQDADFVAAVRGEPVRPRVPYAEALATHRVAVAAARAAAAGTEITLVGAGG